VHIAFTTDDPISDLKLVLDIVNRTLAQRAAPVAAQTVEQQLAAAAAIPGNPLNPNLKHGAPENKLAHLVEAKVGPGASYEVTTPETPLPEISASMMTPTDIADAAIAKAAEEDKPKRGRKPKVEVAKTVTADEVRAIMVEKSKAGAEEIQRQKRILSSMGFEKLSAVPPERLMELKEKLEAA
jgi:hypothetical protein